mmetsp:Transcript_43709/g.103196  ORF Transcript_43709/g.103196 Transcript_43709/m.103196 type:complete len:281 (-) Transcript_43709:66-908(-)
MGLQASCLAPAHISNACTPVAPVEHPTCAGVCLVTHTACMDSHDKRTISTRIGDTQEVLNLRPVPSLSSSAACCTSAENLSFHVQARYGSSCDALRAARQYVKDALPHEAYMAFAAAHEMEEENAAICNEFGQFLLSMGQFEEAEYVFSQALMIDPLNPEYCYRKGVVLQKRRLLVEAAEAFATALRQDPHFVGALFNLGVAHRELGDPHTAAEDFRRILTLEPENQCALALLGECLAEIGDMDGAIHSLEEALRLDPSNRSMKRDLLRLKELQFEPLAA